MKSRTLGTIAVPQLELRLMIFWQSQAFGYGLLAFGPSQFRTINHLWSRRSWTWSCWRFPINMLEWIQFRVNWGEQIHFLHSDFLESGTWFWLWKAGFSHMTWSLGFGGPLTPLLFNFFLKGPLLFNLVEVLSKLVDKVFLGDYLTGFNWERCGWRLWVKFVL